MLRGVDGEEMNNFEFVYALKFLYLYLFIFSCL